jgi:hypothetical protein
MNTKEFYEVVLDETCSSYFFKNFDKAKKFFWDQYLFTYGDFSNVVDYGLDEEEFEKTHQIHGFGEIFKCKFED